MKTIIKEGKKEFTATCSKCGCEFKYELSDVSIGSVYCPYCSNPVHHPDQSGINKYELLHPTMPYPFPNSDLTPLDQIG